MGAFWAGGWGWGCGWGGNNVYINHNNNFNRNTNINRGNRINNDLPGGGNRGNNGNRGDGAGGANDLRGGGEPRQMAGWWPEGPSVHRCLPAETAGIGSIILNTAGARPIGIAPQRIGLAEPRGVIHSRSDSRVRGNR